MRKIDAKACMHNVMQAQCKATAVSFEISLGLLFFEKSKQMTTLPTPS